MLNIWLHVWSKSRETDIDSVPRGGNLHIQIKLEYKLGVHSRQLWSSLREWFQLNPNVESSCSLSFELKQTIWQTVDRPVKLIFYYKGGVALIHSHNTMQMEMHRQLRTLRHHGQTTLVWMYIIKITTQWFHFVVLSCGLGTIDLVLIFRVTSSPLKIRSCFAVQCRRGWRSAALYMGHNIHSSSVSYSTYYYLIRKRY